MSTFSGSVRDDEGSAKRKLHAPLDSRKYSLESWNEGRERNDDRSSRKSTRSRSTSKIGEDLGQSKPITVPTKGSDGAGISRSKSNEDEKFAHSPSLFRSFSPPENSHTPLMSKVSRSVVRGGVGKTLSSGTLQGAYLGHWIPKRVIGSGLCGDVYKAQHVKTKKVCALKCIDFESLTKNFRDIEVTAKVLLSKLENEIRVLASLDHPNVVRLHDAFQVGKNYYICMEYVKGKELLEVLPSRGGLPEAELRPIFQQIVLAVSYCHSMNVIHGDLKLENILISKGKIKIIDFGFSHFYTPGERLELIGGTQLYSPPEKYMSFAWDVWACGVIFFAMATSSLPFRDGDFWRQDLTLTVPRHVSDSAVDLLQHMLELDPEERPTMESILDSPWLLGDPVHSGNSNWSTAGRGALHSPLSFDAQLQPGAAGIPQPLSPQYDTPPTDDKGLGRVLKTLSASKLSEKPPNTEKLLFCNSPPLSVRLSQTEPNAMSDSGSTASPTTPTSPRDGVVQSASPPDTQTISSRARIIARFRIRKSTSKDKSPRLPSAVTSQCSSIFQLRDEERRVGQSGGVSMAASFRLEEEHGQLEGQDHDSAFYSQSLEMESPLSALESRGESSTTSLDSKSRHRGISGTLDNPQVRPLFQEVIWSRKRRNSRSLSQLREKKGSSSGLETSPPSPVSIISTQKVSEKLAVQPGIDPSTTFRVYLLESEALYVQELDFMGELLQECLSKSFLPKDMEATLAFLREMHTMHTGILNSLQSIPFTEVYSAYYPLLSKTMISLYTKYARCFHRCISQWHKRVEGNPDFKKYVSDSKLDMKSYLLSPARRVHDYALIFEEYFVMMAQSPSHADVMLFLQDLRKAVDQISGKIKARGYGSF